MFWFQAQSQVVSGDLRIYDILFSKLLVDISQSRETLSIYAWI